MSDQGLKNRTAKNIGFNAIAKVIMFGLQAVANIVLTRSLVASDYGIVGMAIIFMNFFTLFGDMGISNAVIRKENLTEREVYTGFTVRVIQGILLVLLCLAAAPLASKVFANQEVGKILTVFSFNFVINSFGFIPYVYLNRELRYDRLFIPQVGYAGVGSIVAITLALLGFRHWSLVFSTLSSSVAFVILLNVMRPVRPHFCFDAIAAKSFFNYGMNIFLISFVTYALLNAGNFIIGAVNGPVSLGYYTIANNWGGMICSVVIATVSSVLFPTFARIQDDKNRLRSAYLKVIEYISFIAILANLTLFLTGKEFLYFILGHNSDKWFPSFIAFQILCVFGVLRSLLEPGTNLMMALGNTSIPFRATLIAAVLQLILIYPSLYFGGIEGVAILMVMATTAQFIIYLPAIKSYLDLQFQDFIRQIWPQLVSMIITMLVISLSTPLFIGLSVTTYALKLFLAVSIYSISHTIITRGKMLIEIREMLSKKTT